MYDKSSLIRALGPEFLEAYIQIPYTRQSLGVSKGVVLDPGFITEEFLIISLLKLKGTRAPQRDAGLP